MAKVAAKVYGDALFELAVEENRCDQFLEEICAVENALDQNPGRDAALPSGYRQRGKAGFYRKMFQGKRLRRYDRIFTDSCEEGTLFREKCHICIFYS